MSHPLAELEVASVAALMNALAAHDAGALAALYAEDAVTLIPGVPEVHGREGVERAHVALFAAYPDISFWAPRAWIAGSMVALEWGWAGTQTGPFLGAPATGERQRQLGVSLTTYRDDGLIAREVTYVDTAASTVAKLTGRPLREPAVVAADTRYHVASGTPAEAANLAIVTHLLEALDAGDTPRALALLSDEVVYDDMSAPSVARGKAAVARRLAALATAFPAARIEAKTAFAAGDFVVAEILLTGRHRGALGPLAATDRPVAVHALLIAELEGERIAVAQIYANTGELLAAIGHGHPPSSAGANEVGDDTPSPGDAAC